MSLPWIKLNSSFNVDLQQNIGQKVKLVPFTFNKDPLLKNIYSLFFKKCFAQALKSRK